MHLDVNRTDGYHKNSHHQKMPKDIRAALPTRRALVVDDDFSMRELVAHALELIGFQVREAENGRQAYELFLKGKWDLVVTDYHMPLMDGVTLINIIQEKAPGTPVILISGVLEDSIAIAGTKLVIPVLQKPFSVRELHRKALRVIH